MKKRKSVTKKRPPRKPDRTRKGQVQIGDYWFRVHIVRLFSNTNLPTRLRVRRRDLVIFVNCINARFVTLDFAGSPFVSGNGPQSIRFQYAAIQQVDPGTPVGSYACQKTATGIGLISGPPDGPAVVVDE
jgi:hypothetical protein